MPFFCSKPFTTNLALHRGCEFLFFNLKIHLFFKALFASGNSTRSNVWFLCKDFISSWLASHHLSFSEQAWASWKFFGSPALVTITYSLLGYIVDGMCPLVDRLRDEAIGGQSRTICSPCSSGQLSTSSSNGSTWSPSSPPQHVLLGKVLDPCHQTQFERVAVFLP